MSMPLKMFGFAKKGHDYCDANEIVATVYRNNDEAGFQNTS
jgi:hypothetical protein